jgi:glycine/D-amino acid oxidase-like deaminating enzyme
MQLTERGYNVAVIEAGDVAAGTTGYTTAKVSSQHGLIYDMLIKTIGEESARLYYEANEEAIMFLRHQVERLDIACELETQDAYLYATTSKELAMEREVKAYERLRLHGGEESEEVRSKLPYDIKKAVVLRDQAQFHPVKYLQGLA